MVSTGENFIGSQFFFTLGADLTSLDGTHCVIGEVVEGAEVLRQLNEAIVDDKHRPYKDIRITHTVVLEDPYSDPRGFKQPSRSPSPSVERLKNGRIAADEDIDDTQGKTEAEIQEMLQDREAKARATILEIVGDIPDADVAPPENVLFVCKLNPVTTDDDLQIIFSRFGRIKTCEVIRDKVTGDSLQYAFIEFEEQKSCEDAYFKMDNVLIDDRRIHVDFSQSVSKIKWRGKGNYTILEDSDKFKSEKVFLKKVRKEKKKSESPRRKRSKSGKRNRDDKSRSPKRNHDRDRQRSPRIRLNRERSRSYRRDRDKTRSPKPRYNQRRNDDRRDDYRRRSPRRNSPPRSRYQNSSPSNRRSRSRDRYSPSRRNRYSPAKRSRSRDRNRRPRESSPRRYRDVTPRRDRHDSPKRSKKYDKSRSPSGSVSSRDEKKKKKSSRKHKKKSSKKSKKRSRSSSSSSSGSSSC